ncbi:histidinol-phosphate transaminase [Altericista sp. CCNU0014]|uniref:histidinol-phosphate transaminase n=1 Tax=Altericista sp. CCNU0014 TaxID=3082949 RepID=UPI003850375F
MPFLRKHLQSIAGYTPGEQPPPGSSVIKLNTNENPYPPSPEVFRVLQTLDPEWLRRYPDPTTVALRQAVGEVLNVHPDWIAVGNGSDELIGLVVRAFVEPGETAIYPMPSYVYYRAVAQVQEAQPVEIAYDEAFNFPLKEILDAQGAVTFVASPNSPLGNVVSINNLETLAANLQGLLVVDEAYVDFTSTNALHLVQKYRNVIVLRTLSKGYSLAGLRLGFAIAHPALIRDLNKIKDSYAVDAIAALVGAAAIRDQPYKNSNVRKVLRSRAILHRDLAALGFRVWPSEGNFLLVQPPREIAAIALQQQLKARGILVRHFDVAGVADKLRITVGTDEQNAQLCQRLQELM